MHHFVLDSAYKLINKWFRLDFGAENMDTFQVFNFKQADPAEYSLLPVQREYQNSTKSALR